jgi:hypothetical protein
MRCSRKSLVFSRRWFWLVLGAVFPGGALGQAPVLTNQSMTTTVRFQAVSPVTSQVAWISGTRGAWARTQDGGQT